VFFLCAQRGRERERGGGARAAQCTSEATSSYATKRTGCFWKQPRKVRLRPRWAWCQRRPLSPTRRKKFRFDMAAAGTIRQLSTQNTTTSTPSRESPIQSSRTDAPRKHLRNAPRCGRTRYVRDMKRSASTVVRLISASPPPRHAVSTRGELIMSMRMRAWSGSPTTNEQL
jgi:hypothetical protein